MSSFEVDYLKLRTRSSDIAYVYRTINMLRQQIENCNSSLRYCLSPSSYENIRKSLSATANSLQQQASHLNSLSAGLGNIATTYSNTENRIKTGKLSFLDIIKSFSGTASNLINGGSLSDSWISGSLSGSTSILGIATSGKIKGSLFGYDVSGGGKAKWKIDPKTGAIKDASAEISGSASVYGAKGSAEGNIGLLSGAVSGSVLNAGVSGSIGASLLKDGKLSPSVSASLKAKANVAEGETRAQFGNKYNNAHVKASGEVLGASAEASGSAGVITYKDSAGNEVTAIGAKGEVGAEAYLAQGSISGGFTIFGVKIDASATGKAGGAGVSASGQATTNGVSGSIGAGLGLGAGLSVSVDWSGAVESIQNNWENISSTVSKGWNSITSGVSKLKFW